MDSTPMDYATAQIRLAGELHSTVIKEVSAPEIAILRHIHGEDALIDIKKSRSATVSQADERDRLDRVYGEELMKKLFPGLSAKLPMDLADVGVESEPEAKSSKGK